MEFLVGKKMMVKVEEYQGTYTIVQGYQDKSGKFAPEMCMKRNYESQDYTNKKALAIYMGKGKEGRNNLVALATMILTMFGEHKEKQLDDIPF